MAIDILPRSFYSQPTLSVAKQLLGKLLIVKSGEAEMSGMIVETEAYLWDDPACHGFRGKTARNATLFGKPGHAYVYFTYGSHFMLNAVTAPEGVGEGVLIRAIEPVGGIDVMRANRGFVPEVPAFKLCSGPGKLAKALGITRSVHDGADLCDPDSLVIISTGSNIRHSEIVVSTRIGIRNAVEKPWRFTVAGNNSLSRK